MKKGPKRRMWKIYGAHHTTLYVHIENYARTIRYNQTYRTRRHDGLVRRWSGGLKRHRGSASSYSRPDPFDPLPTSGMPIWNPFLRYPSSFFFFTFSVCVLPFQTKKGETYRSINLSKYFNMLVFLLNSYGLRSFLFCFSSLFFFIISEYFQDEKTRNLLSRRSRS